MKDISYCLKHGGYGTEMFFGMDASIKLSHSIMTGNSDVMIIEIDDEYWFYDGSVAWCGSSGYVNSPTACYGSSGVTNSQWFIGQNVDSVMVIRKEMYTAISDCPLPMFLASVYNDNIMAKLFGNPPEL